MRWLYLIPYVLGCDPQQPRRSPPITSDAPVALSYTQREGVVQSVSLHIPATGRGLEARLANGTITSIQFSSDGLTRGPMLQWHADTLETSSATDADGRSNGIFHTFHDDGACSREASSTATIERGFRAGGCARQDYERGWPIGEWIDYFEDGTGERVIEYVPRGTDTSVLTRPRRLARRCSPESPMVDIVRDGVPVDGVRACAPP